MAWPGNREYDGMDWEGMCQSVHDLGTRVRLLEEAQWMAQGLRPCKKCGVWRAEDFEGCDAEWCAMRGSD